MSEYTREELSESHRILSSLSMRSSTPLEPIPHSPRSSLGNDAKVLPPIILCERDRNILKEITQHIESETEYINEDNVEQAYIIYKGAFDKLIESVTDYRPMLTRIKQEYENLIESIRAGDANSAYLSGQLKGLANAPATLVNYRKRIAQLEDTLARIDTESEIYQHKLDMLIGKNNKNRDYSSTVSDTVPDEPEEVATELQLKCIPGLSLEQSTDVQRLMKEVQIKRNELNDLKVAKKIKYTKKEKARELKKQLNMKSTIRDNISDDFTKLKSKNSKLKVCLQACNEYFSSKDNNFTLSRHLLTSLADSENGRISESAETDDELEISSDFSDEDLQNDHEAENMVSYIEKFSDLLDSECIEEAALHAANSPKGILKTIETLNRFKVVKPTASCPEPLLAALEAFMMVSEDCRPLTATGRNARNGRQVAVLAVKVALSLNRYDLITFWIAQNKLCYCEEVGEALLTHAKTSSTGVSTSVDLAIHVFAALHLDVKTVDAMMLAGKWIQAVDYIKSNPISKSEIYLLFESYTNLHFFKLIMKNKLIDTFNVSKILMKKEKTLFLFDYLLAIMNNEQGGPILNELLPCGDLCEEDNDIWLRVIDRCAVSHEQLALHMYSSNIVRNTMLSAKRRLKR